jgi:hypothetical protein
MEGRAGTDPRVEMACATRGNCATMKPAAMSATDAVASSLQSRSKSRPAAADRIALAASASRAA